MAVLGRMHAQMQGTEPQLPSTCFAVIRHLKFIADIKYNHSDQAKDWKFMGSNPSKAKIFISSLELPDLLWGTPRTLFTGYPCSSLGG